MARISFADRLLRPATLSGLAMVALAIVNADGKRYGIGTISAIDRLGGLDFLDALCVICGVILAFRGFFKAHHISFFEYAGWTVPLLIMIAATGVYLFSGDFPKTTLPIYALCYLLIIVDIRRSYRLRKKQEARRQAQKQ